MKSWENNKILGSGVLILALALSWQAAFAARQAPSNDTALPGPESWPANIRIVRDVPYGDDERQRFDVYGPAGAKGAPVIFMVHGGAWSLGDKAAQGVVERKVARWVTRGFIVISTDYRLLPKADPLDQARDVARALATAQSRAAAWGGDRSRFILMGHSAGAHLVALLTASPSISAQVGAGPWLGSVLLDSAALDVEQIMRARHARFYDRAFGAEPAYWRSVSPFHALTQAGRPILVVCSVRHRDSCPQAGRFTAKATTLGTRATVLEQDLTHADINQRLGEDDAYTEQVESFLRTLDPLVASKLGGRSRARH